MIRWWWATLLCRYSSLDPKLCNAPAVLALQAAPRSQRFPLYSELRPSRSLLGQEDGLSTAFYTCMAYNYTYSGMSWLYSSYDHRIWSAVMTSTCHPSNDQYRSFKVCLYIFTHTFKVCSHSTVSLPITLTQCPM